MKLFSFTLFSLRPEMVVGWYHSHPGFGCWLSGVDVNTQQSFEQLTPRAVAVVVDPIQSVKGKVVIDAFRCIPPQQAMTGNEPRQTTSNVGHLNKPSIQALIHGLNRHYYSIAIDYRKSELEQAMLLNLHKQRWRDAMALDDFQELAKRNEQALDKMLSLSLAYTKWLREEAKMDSTERAVANVGRREPKRHLGDAVDALLSENVQQCFGTMLDTVIF
jgi:26S proteasome regulatory subunit N11